MTHLVLILSLIAVQSGVSADIEERLANETVIVSPQSPTLNPSKTESEIVVQANNSNPQPLWIGEDIVMDSAHDYQAVTVATDRTTGEIYVLASREATEGENNKLPCWHSNDGINWSHLFTVSSSTADLINPSLNVFTTADSDYILVAYERWDTATGERDVRAYRQAIGTTAGIFSDVSAYAGLTEADPDICNSDLRYPNDPWIFCAFESKDSIGFIRSVDYGLTWELRQIIGAGAANWDYRDPDIAFGWMSSPDSMFIGVAWQYANLAGPRELRFRKNTINGTPGRWRNIVFFDCPITAFDDFPTLQMTHGSYPSALIMFQRIDTVTDTRDLNRFWTIDGADTWDSTIQYNSTTSRNKPFGLGINDTLGYYHLVYRDQDGALRYQKSRYDSLGPIWSNYTFISSGNNYHENDFPAVGVRRHQPYVCWADYHDPVYKLKFDAEWLDAIKEQKSSLPIPVRLLTITPNPSAGKMKISYQIKQKGNGAISIYNASGRMVDNLVYKASTIGENNISLDYRHLPAGVYFVSVATVDGTSRQRVTIVK